MASSPRYWNQPVRNGSRILEFNTMEQQRGRKTAAQHQDGHQPARENVRWKLIRKGRKAGGIILFHLGRR